MSTNDKAVSFKNQANEQYKAGKYSEAVTLYQQAIDADPSWATVYSNKAAALVMLHRYTEAIEACQQSLELEPGAVKVLVRLAKCHMHSLDLQSAHSVLTSAEEADNTNASVTETRATLDALQAALKSPMATILDAQNMDADAMQQEDTGAYLVVPAALVTIWKPRTLSGSQLLEVTQQLQEAHQTAPDGVLLRLLLARAHIAQGLYDPAYDLIRSLVEPAIDAHAEHRLHIAFVAAHACFLNKIEDATPYTEMLLHDDQALGVAQELQDHLDSLVAIKKQANDSFRDHDLDAAIAKYSDFLNAQLNAIILSNRALCYIMQKEFDVAIEDLDQSLRVNPHFLKSLLRRGEAYEALGDYQHAAADYNAVLAHKGKEYAAFHPSARQHSFLMAKKQRQDNGANVRDVSALKGVHEIDDEDDLQEIVDNADGLVVIDFSASWCGPCKAIAPVYHELADQLNGKAAFLKVDGDEEPEVTAKYRVRAFPTFVFIKYGQEVARFSGADTQQLYRLVQQHM